MLLQTGPLESSQAPLQEHPSCPEGSTSPHSTSSFTPRCLGPQLLTSSEASPLVISLWDKRHPPRGTAGLWGLQVAAALQAEESPSPAPTPGPPVPPRPAPPRVRRGGQVGRVGWGWGGPGMLTLSFLSVQKSRVWCLFWTTMNVMPGW